MNTAIEAYAIGLLTEEGGEMQQILGKAQRFGIDSPSQPGPSGPTTRDLLNKEAGDVLAAIDYSVARGLLSVEQLQEYRRRKLAKLLDPMSVDYEGRRLAP